jgi:thiamine biosynthesis lipoprotein
MSSPTDIRVAQRRVEHCMGTVFSIDVRTPGVDHAVIESVVAWLHWADATFSTYRPDSEISRLGRGEISLDRCAPDVRRVLERCEQLSAETDGYFSAYAGGALDPSGLVKGWAIERASEMLIAAGSRNHCVNGGGDVQCAGSAAPDVAWRIGIADPHRPGELVAVVAGDGIAVATSGPAERGAHIIDPHLASSPGALASITVVGAGLATVDAYATAAFAMGDRAPAWLESRAQYEALVVHADGQRWSTPHFARHL